MKILRYLALVGLVAYGLSLLAMTAPTIKTIEEIKKMNPSDLSDYTEEMREYAETIKSPSDRADFNEEYTEQIILALAEMKSAKPEPKPTLTPAQEFIQAQFAARGDKTPYAEYMNALDNNIAYLKSDKSHKTGAELEKALAALFNHAIDTVIKPTLEELKANPGADPVSISKSVELATAAQNEAIDIAKKIWGQAEDQYKTPAYKSFGKYYGELVLDISRAEEAKEAERKAAEEFEKKEKERGTAEEQAAKDVEALISTKFPNLATDIKNATNMSAQKALFGKLATAVNAKLRELVSSKAPTVKAFNVALEIRMLDLAKQIFRQDDNDAVLADGTPLDQWIRGKSRILERTQANEDE